MAMNSSYKNRRGTRTVSTDTDFSKGMMFSENNVNDGYVKTLVNFDFENDNKVLTPRAGLRTKDIILPDFIHTYQTDDPFYDEDISIQASKDCVENDSEYRQIIVGVLDDDSDNEGKIWFTTTDKNYTDVKADETMDIGVNVCKLYATPKRCTFFETELPQIHNIKLNANRKFSNAIGTFGFLNSYYFFGIDTNATTQADERFLYRTYYDDGLLLKRYVPEKVTAKVITASEAVNYGYNMLSDSPYVFEDGIGGSSFFQMEGILPYNGQFTETNTPDLIMSPKSNTKIWFRCNYDVPTGSKYDIVWSWKEIIADTWTVFYTETLDVTQTPTDLPVLQADLIPPTAEIMVRCEAYKYEGGTVEEAVEKAMTVGFDFTVNENNTNTNMDQVIYDITTAKGLCFYKNRLVAYGLPQDPTILFLSDYNEPSYFPYPNNIVTFDEPVIHAVAFMDSLIVFTSNKIHQVSVAEDGISWKSEVVQSNLYIEPYDKHLVKVVRNMLYFKSGNYYYMMVPKSTSTTGELTLAPITTPITSFFDNFSANVSKVLKDTFNRNDVYELITYYNFLDYEFIHNVYVFDWGDDDTFIHFDIMYNTNTRYWKICIYENPSFLYPYRNDATQFGLLASTSVNTFYDPTEGGSEREGRLIQIFKFDKNHPKDFYFPSDVEITYYADYIEPTITSGKINIPGLATVSNKILALDNSIVDLPIVGKLLKLSGSYGYTGGFKIDDFDDFFKYIIEHYSDYFTYRNYQFLDTGYTANDFAINKRYRELQLQLSNHSNNDLTFAFDFLVAGEPRKVVYKYEVNHLIDELNPDFGIVDIDSVPYFEVDAEDVDMSNAFTIENSFYSNIDYWKLRANVTGKGVSPRLRLNSRNEVLFQILSLNWVYRVMNMR